MSLNIIDYTGRPSVPVAGAGQTRTADHQEPPPVSRPETPSENRAGTTMGNADVWWYLGGEYGGGNWTMERLNDPHLGFADRVDINDIRVFGGLEWHGLNARVGFFEVGYVFDREIIFRNVPADNLKLDDTVMLRGGVRF